MNRICIPILILLSIILLLLVQCTWPKHWPIWGIYPEFLPALLLYTAFTVNLPTALVLASMASAIYDSFSGGVFGSSIFPYVACTALFCGIRPILFRNQISTHFLSGCIFGFLTLSLQWIFCGKFAIGIGRVLYMLIHLALLTGILAVIYFIILDTICRLMSVDPGRFEEALV